MLGFQLTDEGRTIQIYCDEEGGAVLIRALEKLRADGGHVHLRTRSDGASRGLELSEKDPWGRGTIPEVIIDWVGD
jgi:hypothetical protein